MTTPPSREWLAHQRDLLDATTERTAVSRAVEVLRDPLLPGHVRVERACDLLAMAAAAITRPRA